MWGLGILAVLCGRRLPSGFLESEIPKDYEKNKNKSKNVFFSYFFLGFGPRMSDFSWFSPNFVLLVRILVRARGRKKSRSCDKKISIDNFFSSKNMLFIGNSIRAIQNAIVHPYNPLGPGERSLPSWEFFQKSASLWSLQREIICRSHCPSEGSWPPVRTDIKLYEWILIIFGGWG